MGKYKMVEWACASCGKKAITAETQMVKRVLPYVCAACSRRTRSQFTVGRSGRRWD